MYLFTMLLCINNISMRLGKHIFWTLSTRKNYFHTLFLSSSFPFTSLILDSLYFFSGWKSSSKLFSSFFLFVNFCFIPHQQLPVLPPNPLIIIYLFIFIFFSSFLPFKGIASFSFFTSYLLFHLFIYLSIYFFFFCYFLIFTKFVRS